MSVDRGLRLESVSLEEIEHTPRRTAPRAIGGGEERESERTTHTHTCVGRNSVAAALQRDPVS